MELKKVEKSLEELLRVQKYKLSDNMLTIEAFMRSDLDVAEVVLPKGKYVAAYSAVNSLNGTIKCMHVGAKAFRRNGHVYLVKTTKV